MVAAIPHKRPRGDVIAQRRGLPVYVCEYHDEALRCLHHAIRRRRLPFDGLTLVHLDAHPDLSASATMAAETVFKNPREVYTALRGDAGGIAQWILPAVYGGHLRCVWWLRPSWAEQIADGAYDVAVGRAPRQPEGPVDGTCTCNVSDGQRAPPVPGAAVKRGRDAASVPLLAPVTKDAVFTPSTVVHASLAAAASQVAPDVSAEAETAAATRLAGSEQGAGLVKSDDGSGERSPAKMVHTMPETIHISCNEPYFVEDGTYCAASSQGAQKPLRLLVSLLPDATAPLPTQGGESVPRAGEPWVLDVCLDYFACGNPFLSQVRPHIASAFANVQNRVAFRQIPVEDVLKFCAQRDAFDAAYRNLLLHHLAEITRDAARDDEGPDEEDVEGEDDEEDEAARSLLNELAAFFPPEAKETLLHDLEAALLSAREGELREVLEAGDMVTLPLHRPSAESKEEVYTRLSEFEAFLTRLVGGDGFGTPPSVVTIARSVVDGFCPMRWLCELEQGVVAAIQRQLGAVEIAYSDELDLLEYR